MKKIGILLLLCWPLSIAYFGLHAWLAKPFYISSGFFEIRGASIQIVQQAYAEISPKPAGVEIGPVSNTDLYFVTATDSTPEAAASKAGAVLDQLVGKLSADGDTPSIKQRAEPSNSPTRFPLLPNLLAGFAIGLVPAVIGLVLLVLGRGRPSASAPTAPQIA